MDGEGSSVDAGGAFEVSYNCLSFLNELYHAVT